MNEDISRDLIKKVKAKEEQKKRQIQSLLSNPKPIYKSLGCGIHNDTYYFGTKLFQNGKEIDAIITNEKEIFIAYKGNDQIDEIKEDFGLNYRFPLLYDCIDGTWDYSSIEHWLYEQARETSIKEIYDLIIPIQERNIWHPDKRFHQWSVCDIISSYFTDCFESMCITYHSGEKGSGKTRQAQIYALLSFNPLFSSNISGASIYRIVESTKGTLIVDDFDDCNEEEKKSIERCLKAYKKGQKAVRSDDKTPIAFDLYSKKICNNVGSLGEVLEDRCNKHIMVKTTDKSKTAKLDINKKHCQFIRNQLHICALQNWEKVKELSISQEIKELLGRELEREEPVLIIAKLVNEEIYQNILSYILERNSERKVKELETDWSFQIAEYLAEQLREDNSDNWIYVKQITEHVAELNLNSEAKEYQSRKHGLSIFIGNSLSRYSSLFKVRGYKGCIQYNIKRSEFIQFLKIREWEGLIKTNSTNPTLSTYSTYSTQSTNTTHKVELVESVASENEVKVEINQIYNSNKKAVQNE